MTTLYIVPVALWKLAMLQLLGFKCPQNRRFIYYLYFLSHPPPSMRARGGSESGGVAQRG